MTQSKNTKKALLMSMLSILLCIAMLIGSTFAWFTDSVTSGRNKIVAGNLDIELYRGVTMDDSAKVTKDTMLFQNPDGTNITWEPGVVIYENFTVKNVGSLALKYSLALNVVDKNFVKDTTKSLADVVKVAFLNKHFTGDRTEAEALTDYKPLENTAKTGTLLPEEKDETRASEKFAIVLYWQPGEHDNDYNLNNGNESDDGDPLFIQLGVDLNASQYTYEKDSFNELYDDFATDENKDIIPLTHESKPVDENGPFSFSMPGNTVTGNGALTAQFPAESLDDTAAHTVELIAETQKPYDGEEKNPEKQAIANVELTLLVDDAEVHTFNGKTVTITTYIPTDLINVEVVYKGASDEVLEGTVYDKATGKLTFKTDHFSLFEIRADRLMTLEEEQKAKEGYIFKVDDTYYQDLDQFATSINTTYKRYRVSVKEGGTFKILADTNLKYTLCIGEETSENATVDLTGHTVTFLRTKGDTGDALGFNVEYSADHVTIKNGAIKAWSTGDGSGGAAVFGREKGFTLRNLEITNIGHTGSNTSLFAVCCGSDAGQYNQSYIYDCVINGDAKVGSQSYLNVYNTVVNGMLSDSSSAFLYIEDVTVNGELHHAGQWTDNITIKSGHFKTMPQTGKYTLVDGSRVEYNESTGMYDVIAE